METGRASNKSGFTLVELLVVIGIIAVLAAFLLPTLAQAKAKAQRVGCGNIVRQLQIAMQMYAEDNEDCLPVNYCSCIGICPTDPSWVAGWMCYETSPPAGLFPSHCTNIDYLMKLGQIGRYTQSPG